MFDLIKKLLPDSIPEAEEISLENAISILHTRLVSTDVAYVVAPKPDGAIGNNYFILVYSGVFYENAPQRASLDFFELNETIKNPENLQQLIYSMFESSIYKDPIIQSTVNVRELSFEEASKIVGNQGARKIMSVNLTLYIKRELLDIARTVLNTFADESRYIDCSEHILD